MAKPKKPLSYTGANEMDAQNIVLVVNNDQWLHNTRKAEFQKNLLRKRKSGRYDFEKSIRLFRYLADEADKAERGGQSRFSITEPLPVLGVKGFTYSVPTRNLAARMFAEEFRDQVEERAHVGDDPYVVPYGELTYLAQSAGIWNGRLVGDESSKARAGRRTSSITSEASRTKTMARRTKKDNKYEYLYIVQGNYGDTYGWEDLTASDDRAEARRDLRDYTLNEPYPHRTIRRRVLKDSE